jgi:hypothetical protein
MTSFLSVMQYQSDGRGRFRRNPSFDRRQHNRNHRCGVGLAAVIGLSWALVMRDAAYGSAVHSAVGNVISCIGLIAIVAYRVSWARPHSYPQIPHCLDKRRRNGAFFHGAADASHSSCGARFGGAEVAHYIRTWRAGRGAAGLRKGQFYRAGKTVTAST